jgi:hypothetical protein
MRLALGFGAAAAALAAAGFLAWRNFGETSEASDTPAGCGEQPTDGRAEVPQQQKASASAQEVTTVAEPPPVTVAAVEEKAPAIEPSTSGPKDALSIGITTGSTTGAELAARVQTIVDDLRPTHAGTERRRELVFDLLDTLHQATTLPTKAQRVVARGFVDNDGPQIVYEMESCMNGDWMADAKNGTMQALSKISRLSGPIGKAVDAYRRVAEKAKLDAAHGGPCGHDSTQQQQQQQQQIAR